MRAEWAEVLATVREATRGPAILAGGAPRDYDLGRPVKDLDIFVPGYNAESFASKVGALCSYWGLPSEAFLHDESYRVWNTAVTGVAGWLHDLPDGQIPVQIIGMDVPELWSPGVGYIERMSALVGTFDMGICQIAWDGTFTFRSQQYFDDLVDQRITLMPCQMGFEDAHEILARTLKRLVRISDKYPDYAPRVADNFFGPDRGFGC